MEKVSEEISRVEVADDLHVCPRCGYQRGFHLSFIARQGTDSLSLILICPNCGARFDIGQIVWPPPPGEEAGIPARGRRSRARVPAQR